MASIRRGSNIIANAQSVRAISLDKFLMGRSSAVAGLKRGGIGGGEGDRDVLDSISRDGDGVGRIGGEPRVGCDGEVGTCYADFGPDLGCAPCEGNF